MATIFVGLMAWTWDLFAHQVPSSSLHVNGYPSAIDRLAQHAWIEAALLFALVPRAFSHDLDRAPGRARAVVVCAIAGTTLALGSLCVSARTGVLAMQLRDTTSFASALLAARLAGESLLLAALLIIVRGAMREPPAPPASTPRA